MKNKSLLLVGLLFVSGLLAACNGDATLPDNKGALEVNEVSVSEDTLAEPIFINNCGNPATAEQVSERSQTVTVEVGAELGFNAQVVQGSVEGKYISSEGVTKSQRVTAAPYTNMKFVLLWTEQVSKGTVTAEGQSGQATYRVSVPISVEQVSAENLGCPDTPQPTSLTPDTTSATVTVAPLPDFECDTVNVMPEENTEFRRGQSFKIKFTLVNSGSVVWPEDIELALSSNPDRTINPAPALIKVPRVQPGDSINVGPFDATAPNKEGHYVVAFKLGDGFCWPYVAFDVVK